MHGYDAFFDYQSIDSGNFETVILDNIKARAHFIVVLTPSALENCNKPGDWLRREIETAIDENRNIIPLMVENFDFGSSQGKLSKLSTYNGLPVPNAYALEAMERLRERYLNKAVGDISTPNLQPEAQTITETQKIAANEAAPVQEEELNAQTWFERGYTFQSEGNFDEALRCFTEAIRLESRFDRAYLNRGFTLRMKEDIDEAVNDYDLAISLKPDPLYYVARSNAHFAKKDYDMAIADCNKAIQIDAEFAAAYYMRGDSYLVKGEIDFAITDYSEAINLNPNFVQAYQSRAIAWEKKKEFSNSITDYQKYLELGGGTRNDKAKEKIKELKSKLTKKKSTSLKKAKAKGADF